MTTIESVAARQRGAYDFLSHYENLCALQSSCPLPAVKSHLTDRVLDINGDRIRAVDWMPILNSIRINKTLEFIAIRSRFQRLLDDQESQSGIANLKRKAPAIRSKEISYRVCKALKECLCVSPALCCIELDGLPLRSRDLSTLARGVAKNETLKHLSVENCHIGDEGLDVLCKGVKNSLSVTSLNFTQCSLSWKGADTLAKIIKHQATKRHNEAWKDSLRYRRPDLDRMNGIRRITVNCNPLLGDQGAVLLAEALKDDLWLKALDLQQCGLGDTGAKSLLEVLKYNTTIVVMDLRQNALVDHDLLRSIMEQVMINCNGQETEFKWIKAETLGGEEAGEGCSTPSRDPAARRRRTKTLQNSFGKKTTIRVTRDSSKRRTTPEMVKPSPGMPWRTAMRANRNRGYPPDARSPGVLVTRSRCDDLTPSSSRLRISYDSDDDTSQQDADDKQTQVELEELRRRLSEETKARVAAEEKVIELTMELARVRWEAEQATARQSVLDDDRVLDSIEQSFQQFHAFLDLIRDAGLGQLISLAGIDQTTVPFGKGNVSLNVSNNSAGNNSSAPLTNGFHPEQHPPVTTSHRPTTDIDEDETPSAREQRIRSGLTMPNMSVAGNKPPRMIHAKPDNYQTSQDPTMNSTMLTQDTKKTATKFDDLYDKVLKDTEGVLSRSQTKPPVLPTSVQTELPRRNGFGDQAQDEIEEISHKSSSVKLVKSVSDRGEDELAGLDPADQIVEHQYLDSEDEFDDIEELLESTAGD